MSLNLRKNKFKINLKCNYYYIKYNKIIIDDKLKI